MRILFLCGSLEPGRDGVGDYTRRLAGELIRQGHEGSIIALKDRHIDLVSETEQESDGTFIPVLRLSAIILVRQRYAKAKEYIDQFNPELISLQYVPFSFHPKGLPFGLARQLKKLGEGRKWHIMFHELWVGMDQEAPLKYVLWGKLQQHITHQMIDRLRPKIIHTQTRLYQMQLNKLGSPANYLPLFGNIPVRYERTTTTTNAQKTLLLFVVFGTIHPRAPIEDFARELAAYGIGQQQIIQITFIGRCGTELDKWVSICNHTGLKTIVLGEQEPERISEALSSCDWGISSTPYLLSEKSGTIAAMLEHGLPVISVSSAWKVKSLTGQCIANVYNYKTGSLAKLFLLESPIINTKGLIDTTQQFLKILLETN